MSTVRRSRAMPTDGPTAKFLYTIIKQLDLKCIDWNLVASQLEISNGHAARMRYSRFRQQMEGITSTPRSSKAKKTASKSTKAGASSSKADLQKETSPEPLQTVKQEHPSTGSPCESNPYIKTEPYNQPMPNLADIPHVASQSHAVQMQAPHIHPHTHTQTHGVKLGHGHVQASGLPVQYPSPPMTLPELAMYSAAPAFPSNSMGFELPHPHRLS